MPTGGPFWQAVLPGKEVKEDDSCNRCTPATGGGTAVHVSQTGKTSGHRQAETGRSGTEEGQKRQKRERAGRTGSFCLSVYWRACIACIACIACMQGGKERGQGWTGLQPSCPSRLGTMYGSEWSFCPLSSVRVEASKARTTKRDSTESTTSRRELQVQARTPLSLQRGLCKLAGSLRFFLFISVHSLWDPFAFFWVENGKRERAG